MKTAIHALNVLILIFLALSSVLNAAKAPNFILVYMDDLGWAETSVPMIKGLGDTSSDFNQTPNVEGWPEKEWSCRLVILLRLCALLPATASFTA